MGGDLGPVVAMVLVQVGFAGLNILSKLAMDSGMNPFVLLTYRQIFATLVTVPFAWIWERTAIRTITMSVLFQIFFCSLFGATLNQILYILGLKFSTPTIACALNNLLPAITFVMAIPFKMETVRIKRISGQAKIWGTVLCVGGSMMMTFYRGDLIHIKSFDLHWEFLEKINKNTTNREEKHMALGSMLVILSCVAWGIWFIIQAKMSKNFTTPYTSSAIMSAMATLQCATISGFVERRASEWKLSWNIRLLASAYTGIIASGGAFSLMTWCIQKKGPLYVSMFSPLLLVIVAVIGWAIQGEKLYVGSVVGSIIIVVGLYSVLWGKGEEMKEMDSNSLKIRAQEEFEEENGTRSINLPVYFNGDLDACTKKEDNENQRKAKNENHGDNSPVIV